MSEIDRAFGVEIEYMLKGIINSSEVHMWREYDHVEWHADREPTEDELETACLYKSGWLSSDRYVSSKVTRTHELSRCIHCGKWVSFGANNCAQGNPNPCKEQRRYAVEV